MGSHWHHRYDRVLIVDGNTVKVPRPDGKVYTFTDNGGTYSADGDINATLVNNGNDYTYTDASDNVEQYNTAGQLISITNKAGLTQTLVYDLDDDSTTLDRVTGPFGRTLSLTYNDNGLIDTLTDPAGNITSYAYDDAYNLVSVTRPDTTVRTYHYENTDFIHHLTGITDENSNRLENYAYDEKGRAILSEIIGGIERIDVVYNADGSASVTDSLGETRSYTFSTVLDVRLLSAISGGPSANNDDVQSTQLDANGNVTQSTDFNGNVTHYAYNSRNLQTSRTEAAGMPQERTITTQWHANFRLPIQVDYPGQSITYSYDAQGRLLSRTVTDTATSQSSTTSYSYNDQGLVETIDGPRTDVIDVTSYSYDAQGNRTSTTNALYHTAQVTQYNAHGQPIWIIDANGISTQLAYDTRRRLISNTVAPGTAGQAVTAYQYDGVGNLILITLPDGSSLSYGYDVASRLTSVSDNLGNRIDYTLDSQGNRIGEQTRAPGGVLRKQLQRSYDNLNRLQQLIGLGG